MSTKTDIGRRTDARLPLAEASASALTAANFEDRGPLRRGRAIVEALVRRRLVFRSRDGAVSWLGPDGGLINMLPAADLAEHPAEAARG